MRVDRKAYKNNRYYRAIIDGNRADRPRQRKVNRALREVKKFCKTVSGALKPSYECRLETGGVSGEFSEYHIAVVDRSPYSYASRLFSIASIRVHYQEGFPVEIISIHGENFDLKFVANDKKELIEALCKLLQCTYVSLLLGTYMDRIRLEDQRA